MMRTVQLIRYLLIIILLLWIIPWSFLFLTGKPVKTPFVLYSCVLEDFCIQELQDGVMVRRDAAGNTYTQQQMDSLLPTFYYRELIAREELPDTIHGREISQRFIQQENSVFRSTPSQVNKTVIPLYPLLESMSGRVELEMPDDVFRITDRIEFINMERNEVDQSKSDRFNDLFLRKGFSFPARIVAGNPTTRKDYDEGYLLCDAKDNLFHFKQIQGQPYLRPIELPKELIPRHLFVTENRNRRSLGLLFDEKGRFFVIDRKSYIPQQVEIPTIDLTNESISVIANAFDWTIRITRENGEYYHAVSSEDYRSLKEISFLYPEPSGLGALYEWIFPIRLQFLSPKDPAVFPRVNS